MERIKNTNWFNAVLLILLSGILWTCTDERIDTIPTIQKKESSVTFSIKVPSAGTPKNTGPNTYAMTETDENEVEHIAVLLFDSDDKYTYQPIYVSRNNIITNPADSRIKTFTLEIPEGTYNMVVLANSHQSLNNVLSTIIVGQPKAEVLNKLLLSNNGKWNAASGTGNYIHIPMWGEVANISVTTILATPIKLVRMIAKIDVALTSYSAKAQLNLESVRLYNYNEKGHIVPNMSNWNNSQDIATAPTIPAGAIKNALPLVYNGSAITQESGRGVACSNEIYTFEAVIGSSTTLPTNTCLVVGGKYNGDSEVTYYRIDFANTIGGVTTFLPILRNHNYKVNISNIYGSGFSTPEQAFKSKPVNIEASIINWDDAQITQIVYNGQYMLGVSKEEFTFIREVRSYDNELLVTTDYPSGWKVDKIVDASDNSVNWLTVAPQNGVMGAITSTVLTLTENNSADIRTAFIHLSAGSLSYIVTVNQLVATQLSLSLTNTASVPVSITKLDFIGTTPAQQQFKLSWLPQSSSLTYVNIPPQGNPFVFATGAGLYNGGEVSDPSGTKTLTIRPTAITNAELNSNPFHERNATLLYTISDGTTALFKTLALRHYVPTVIPTVEDIYMMDGGQKSFGVRSNVPFTVSVKTNTKGVVTSLSTTSGTSNTSATPTPIYFDIINGVNDHSLLLEDVVVTISSPTGLFADKDVTLKCLSGVIQPPSNSYIVGTNSPNILIPVSRANESLLNEQLGANDSFTASLVWTDNSNRVATNSNIREVTQVDVGSSRYLVVKTGSAEGNALVAIKKGTTIIWSWHIWVTDYIPTSTEPGSFMDRNLGAIGNTAGAVATKGFLYQWGRKDPFTGSNSIDSNSPDVPLYNATGGVVSLPSEAFTSGDNFANSVANPTKFYSHNPTLIWERSVDWYGSGHNDALWGTNKTVYDPCPPGWRVPENNVWSGLNNGNFSWNAPSKGRTNNNYGGFYPASGYRSGTYVWINNPFGKMFEVGTNGYYWSASVDGNQARNLQFNNNQAVSTSSSNNRANGYPVRCVEDK